MGLLRSLPKGCSRKTAWGELGSDRHPCCGPGQAEVPSMNRAVWCSLGASGGFFSLEQDPELGGGKSLFLAEERTALVVPLPQLRT